MYAAQLQGSLEALNAGVTTLTDYCHNILTPDHAHEAIRGSAESGMRAVWNYGFNFPPSESPHFKSLDQRVAFLDEIAADISSPDNLLTLGVALWLEASVRRFTGGADSVRSVAARNVGAHMFWHANSGPTPEGQAPRDVAALAEERDMLGSDITFVHMAATEPGRMADAGRCRCIGCLHTGNGTTDGHDVAKQHYGERIRCEPGPTGPASSPTPGRHVHGSAGSACRQSECRALGLEGAMEAGVPVTRQWKSRTGEQLMPPKRLALTSAHRQHNPGKRADLVLLRGDAITLAGWDRSNRCGRHRHAGAVNRRGYGLG